MKQMYQGIANSPETFLTNNLVSGNTVMYISDASVLPDLPTLAVIGKDQKAETIKVLSKRSDNGFNIERGIEGFARDWEKGEVVARNFTNYDYQTLIDNVGELDNNKVDKVNGKQLSTNDFTDTQKEKLAGLSNYTHPSTHPATMITQDSTHRFVSDSEKSTWNNKYGSGSDISRGKTGGYGTATVWQATSSKRDLEDWIGDFDKRTRENKSAIALKMDKSSIVNDLTTGGVDKPLSAEQGKVINNMVSTSCAELGNKVDTRASQTSVDSLTSAINNMGSGAVKRIQRGEGNLNGSKEMTTTIPYSINIDKSFLFFYSTESVSLAYIVDSKTIKIIQKYATKNDYCWEVVECY